MKPICSSCGYVFDHDAPKGRLYRCAKCREFFRVGDDLEQHISTNESVNVTKVCADSKETTKGEDRFILSNTTIDREILPDMHDIATNIEPQSRMQTTERRNNKENVFRQMVHEYFEIPRFIKNYYATFKGSQDASPKQNRVPIVVRIYGTIFMVSNIIGMILSILVCLYILLMGSVLGAIVGGIFFPISFVFYRIGKGLKNGKRSSVYALCILAVLGIVILMVMKSKSYYYWTFNDCLINVGIWALVYLPPIFSAFSHWDAFSKGSEI